MTTQIDLDKLEAAARAATPGETTFGSCNLAIKMDGWYHVLARCVKGGTDSEEWLANAAFWQAANPAVVLELVRRLRAAEADAKRLDFMAQHGAWIAWSKDHEKCRVFVRNEDGEHLPIMGWINEAWRHTEREAIDAAITAQGASHD